MAQGQKISWISPSTQTKGMDAKNLNINVAQAGLTDLISIPALGLRRVFAQISVTNAALNKFVISGRAVKNGPLTPLFSTGADFTVPRGILNFASGDLTNIAAGATGSFLIEASGFYEFVLQAASSSGAGSVVTVNAGGSQ